MLKKIFIINIYFFGIVSINGSHGASLYPYKLPCDIMYKNFKIEKVLSTLKVIPPVVVTDGNEVFPELYSDNNFKNIIIPDIKYKKIIYHNDENNPSIDFIIESNNSTDDEFITAREVEIKYHEVLKNLIIENYFERYEKKHVLYFLKNFDKMIWDHNCSEAYLENNLSLILVSIFWYDEYNVYYLKNIKSLLFYTNDKIILLSRSLKSKSHVYYVYIKSGSESINKFIHMYKNIVR